uniref:mRNA (guanine-N(7))-methyltransferase n=1 Tax=viral metagenome TaxID=1070528 RepID=A0A6C0I6T3_9ZZZZ
MSKSIEMEKGNSNEKSPDTPHFLIREEKPGGIIQVRPRFESPLNYIFSNMTKQEKIALLKKSEEDQIDELKELYRREFIRMPIEEQKGIMKKLSYNNSQYDNYKLVEFLPTIQISDEKTKKSDYNLDKQNPRQQLLYISQQLLQSQKGKYDDYEMEVKFGTRGIKWITKQDYDNVVKKIKDMGFLPIQADGYYSLKIQPEFIDARTGEFRTSNDMDRFRVEINGLTNIQEYCRSDNIEHMINTKTSQEVSIMKKTDVKFGENQQVTSADFDDFNFRVTFKKEETISKTSKIASELISNWHKSKKIYRYINRVTFEHKDYPFKIDLSIVRSSSKDVRGRLSKTYNVKDSNVFQNNETYEIEIEVKNNDAKIMYRGPQELANGIEKVAKIVLSGLQKTNYPVSYVEQKKTMNDYMRLIHEEEFKKKNLEYLPKERVYPSDFIGPSSVTLQLKNIAPINPDINVPNITAPYSYVVTDKADGDRHLLYINSIGRIYLINSNMEIIFTGAKTENDKCFNTIIDGELILHDKNGSFINTFAAFDIYFVNGLNIRARPFVEVKTKDPKYFVDGCRLPILKDIVRNLNPISIIGKSPEQKKGVEKILEALKKENKSPITIIVKHFYPRFTPSEGKEEKEGKEVREGKEDYNIFEGCNYILQRIRNGLYDYNTDGLIFTPTLLGVCGSQFLEAGPLKKSRWDYSFKWKPVEFNTIDFLITTKKSPDGTDIVTPIFENGQNFNDASQFTQYKTLILRVGFDEKKHGYINPCQDVLEDKLPSKGDDNDTGYKPVQFYPSDPYDAQAGLCNLLLSVDQNGEYIMMTQEGDVFGDNTVVEFSYDMNQSGLFRWIPLRVRYDKTAEFRQGRNSFGNDYDTANNNWHSIHYPVTEEMIATGRNIPSEMVSEDVYYNRVTSDNLTSGLRDFHNLFVKKTLIQSVSKKGNTLIDYACGKGGDFPKWIAANLSFVFGIDISKDNIENRINGACARFLNYKKEFTQMPYALFVNGNSSQNIRSGKAMLSDKAIAITKSVFGSIANDPKLGPAVARQHGKGDDGFNISSCQFAVHYMFENNTTFYNFLRNIAECTKLNGYFIGTSYDGKAVFNMLKRKELMEIYAGNGDKKVWAVSKDYTAESFPDDDSSLGYQISVYQESINQSLPEYLVNYDFFITAMEKYGFVIVPRDEAKTLGLPEGTGMFIELYNMMMDEIKRNPKRESDYRDAATMRKYEKDISFLNRYFVFKKIRTINAEKLTNSILGALPSEYEFEEAQTKIAKKVIVEQETKAKAKAKPKALARKLVLMEATEAQVEPEVIEEKVEPEVIEEKEVVAPLKKSRTKKALVLEEDVSTEQPLKSAIKKSTRKKAVEFNIEE